MRFQILSTHGKQQVLLSSVPLLLDVDRREGTRSALSTSLRCRGGFPCCPLPCENFRRLTSSMRENRSP